MIQPKAAIGVGVLALAGLGAVAYYSSSARAAQAPAAYPGSYTNQAATAPAVPAIVPPGADSAVTAPPAATSLAAGSGAVATPVAGQRVVYRDRVVYRTATPRYYVHRRSKKHSAEIIGGSALGGAGIGALVGGGKGALVGGLVGGAAGTVYDRTTHKKVVRQ